MVEILNSIECKDCVSAFNKLFFYINVGETRIWVSPDVIRTEVQVLKHKNYLRKVRHHIEIENSVLVPTGKEYLLYLDENYQTIVLKVSDNEKIEIESYNNSSDLTITRISNLIFITAKTGTSDPEILLKIDNELYYIDTKRKRLKRIYSRSLPPSSFGIKEDVYEDMIEYGASRGVPVYVKDVNKFDNVSDIEDEDKDVVDY